MRVYVASSWRNAHQQSIVGMLRAVGHEVYDFKNPKEGDKGFHWSEIDKDWQDWTPTEYRQNLTHPVAESGFKSDFDAMKWADVCVIMLPCGRSAHTEAGWMSGAGKKVYALIYEREEPELMYKIFDGIFVNAKELIEGLEEDMKSHRKYLDQLPHPPLERYDMNKEEFEKTLTFFTGLIPVNSGETVKQQVEYAARRELLEYKESAINDFCKRHNLCPLCITGGWNCDSDHK